MALAEPEQPEGLGRRCELGCESWPDSNEYAVCPRCGGETTRFSNLQPLSEAEARSIKRHIEFNAYYEHQHCLQRGISPSGPLPPEYEEQLPPLDVRLTQPSTRR